MASAPGLKEMVVLVERALVVDLAPCGSPAIWRGEVGRPTEVIIIVTEAGIDVRCPMVEWRTPHDPVSTSRSFVLLAPADLPAKPAAAEQVIRHLADAVRLVGRGQYQTCTQCHQSIPPGCMHDPDTCLDCAKARGGAAF